MNRHPIDEATANRLLSGQLSPEDAPPGYSAVAGLIRTATGPASQHELAGQDWLVATATATVRSAPTNRPSIRRNSMLSKLMSAKVAAVAAAATLGAAGVAVAATGNLPSGAQSAVSGALSHMSVNIPRPGGSTPTTTPHATTSRHAGDHDGQEEGQKPGNNDQGANDDDANFGQCTAFLAGSSNGRSHKDHSTDFEDLIADHGGSVASATTFCKKVVAAHHDDDNNKTTATTEKPDDTGKPADTGKPSTPGNPGAHSDETTSQHGSVTTHHP